VRSSFFGIEIGYRALTAQRGAMDVVGHNIANANTEGYSRQRATLKATAPHSLVSLEPVLGAGQVGTGVEIEQITRVRDAFLDHQFREACTGLGEWRLKSTLLSQVEGAVAEPTEVGIRAALDEFWTVLQELADNPETAAVRASVRQQGIAVTESFRMVHDQLEELVRSADEEVRSRAAEVNDLLEQIHDLSRNISNALAAGEEPNDQMDRRGVLVDRLSEIVDTRVERPSEAGFALFVSGVLAADSRGCTKVEVTDDPVDGSARLYWEGTSTEFEPLGGELRALLEVRDDVLPSYLSDLDVLAATFVSEVNALHSSGYGLNGSTGIDFFDPGSTAGTMSLTPEILQDLDNIAASSGGEPGDGSNALAMAQLRDAPLIGGATLTDYYATLLSRLGIDARAAASRSENQSYLKSQVELQRESVSGVSLDEEMAGLLRYRHAYNAAARYVSVVDTMLETLTNELGA